MGSATIELTASDGHQLGGVRVTTRVADRGGRHRAGDLRGQLRTSARSSIGTRRSDSTPSRRRCSTASSAASSSATHRTTVSVAARSAARSTGTWTMLDVGAAVAHVAADRSGRRRSATAGAARVAWLAASELPDRGRGRLLRRPDHAVPRPVAQVPGDAPLRGARRGDPARRRRQDRRAVPRRRDPRLRGGRPRVQLRRPGDVPPGSRRRWRSSAPSRSSPRCQRAG